ncbi:MAG: hypothetical protein CMM87_04810 [Rickettsiales bacterium]|nr:hypothetical protein [Rickettsiales bacterium]|tara:strand:- start:24088 stop:25788 length:1701 start_codon:yes stop_codon:yes gene_type:complete
MFKKILTLSFFILPLNFICAEGGPATKNSSWLPDFGIGRACVKLSERASIWANPAECGVDPLKVYTILNDYFVCRHSRESLRNAFPCLRKYKKARENGEIKAPSWDKQVDNNSLSMMDIGVESLLKKPEDTKEIQKKLFFSAKKVTAYMRQSGFLSYYNAIKEIMYSSSMPEMAVLLFDKKVSVSSQLSRVSYLQEELEIIREKIRREKDANKKVELEKREKQIFGRLTRLQNAVKIRSENKTEYVPSIQKQLETILSRKPFNGLDKKQKKELIELVLAYNKNKNGFEFLVDSKSVGRFFEFVSEQKENKKGASVSLEIRMKNAYQSWSSQFLKDKFLVVPSLPRDWQETVRLDQKGCWTHSFSNFLEQTKKNSKSCTNDPSRVLRILGWGLKCDFTKEDWIKWKTCFLNYKNNPKKTVSLGLLDITDGSTKLKDILDMVLDWITKEKLSGKDVSSAVKFREIFISEKRLLELDLSKSEIKKLANHYVPSLNGYKFKVSPNYGADLIRRLVVVEENMDRLNGMDANRSIESDMKNSYLVTVDSSIANDIYNDWLETLLIRKVRSQA